MKKVELELGRERILPGDYHTKKYYSHLARYDFAKDYCNGKIVGDIACGSGYGSNHLLKEGKAKEVYGVDVCPRTIEAAKKTFNNEIVFSCENATVLSFEDNFFDVIVSFETIEHIEDYEAHLEEIKRILKPGGIYIVSTPNKKFSSPFRYKPKNIYHVIEWKIDEFRDIINNHFDTHESYSQHIMEKPNLRVFKMFIQQNIFTGWTIKLLLFFKNYFYKDKPIHVLEKGMDEFEVKRGLDNDSLFMVYVCKNMKNEVSEDVSEL